MQHPPSSQTKWLHKLLVITLAFASSSTFAAVQVYDNPDLTTPAGENPDDPSTTPAIGVWVDFNATPEADKVFIVDNLAGIEGRTGLDHGRFEIVWNNNYDPPAAQILLQGVAAFGNAVLGTATATVNPDTGVTTARLSPERLSENVTIDASTFLDPADSSSLVAQYLETAGTFGVWNPDLGRGFIAVRFNTGFFIGESNYHYGYIDVTINPDYSTTVHGIAWNDVGGEAITTAFIGASSGPAAATNLSASALSAHAIQLTWEDDSSEDGFRIERSLAGGNTFSEIDTVAANTTNYLDLSVSPETSYDYKVVATLGASESDPSNIASATTPADSGAPAAPSNVLASFSSTVINLSWTDSSSNEAYFVIERSFDGEAFEVIATVAANSTSYADTQLVGGFTYDYRIRAENPAPSANATISVFLPDSASTIAADFVRGQAAYGSPTGNGWTLGLWDSAPALASHQEFTNGRMNIVQGSGSDGHATHTAGIAIANGTQDGAQGIAPEASIDFYTISDATNEVASVGMTLPGEAGKLTISNHSYRLVDAGWETSIDAGVDWVFRVANTGTSEDARFGQYSSIVQDLDEVLFDAPYHLMVRSGNNDRDDGPEEGDIVYLSNAADSANQSVSYNPASHPLPDGEFDGGYDTLNSESLAKNVLTVGSTGIAVRDRSTAALISASDVSASSAWGPADDGRIKPDLVALGESVYNADDASDSSYSTRTGVSMASPAVAAAAVLLSDSYYTFFEHYLRSSTLKALFIHSADDLAPTGPDYRTGWGLANTKAAADIILQHSNSPELRSILEGRLTTADPVETFTISVPGGPFKATLTWLDPAGNAKNSLDDTTPDLVRDLDIRITDGATTYYPYVMPFAQAPLTATPDELATTGDNTTDNVEQIYVAHLPAGDYTVTLSQKTTPSSEGSVFSLIMTGHDSLQMPGDGTSTAVQATVAVEESPGMLTLYGTGFQLGASKVSLKKSSDGSFAGYADYVEVFADGIRFQLPSSLADVAYDIEVNGVTLKNAILPSGFVGDTYALWVQDKFPASTWTRPDITGESADEDGDSFSNFLEYALGLSPDVAESSLPISLLTEGTGENFRIGLSFPQRSDAADLSYTLEAKDALSDTEWDPLSVEASATGSAGSETTPSKLIDSASPQDKRFIRLKVESSPVNTL
ncbi:S8 family serine peptidase [Coraliomargarita sp. SDUM461003]|uniref:S8 family serine peptidase n=1 Tax=Thalassobacterium maritimum TaxID=3041265 RepID=A0ABU1AZD5_9BACT|nr:S8 family serine peptidase [Coraliomargarita sp. SDUM461003]MDQ8209478.1 S8 family serine peptidase [Coraliomargarita sp. SDUM461003]